VHARLDDMAAKEAQLIQMNTVRPKKAGQPHTLVIKNVHAWPVTVDIAYLGTNAENIERHTIKLDSKKKDTKEIPSAVSQIKARAWVIDQTLQLKVMPPANGKVSLTIVGCQNLMDADWIGGGLSDPKVVGQIRGKQATKFETKVVNENLDPVFNHVQALDGMSATDYIDLEVLDKDPLKQDFLGAVSVRGDQILSETGFEGSLVLKAKKKGQELQGEASLSSDAPEDGEEWSARADGDWKTKKTVAWRPGYMAGIREKLRQKGLGGVVSGKSFPVLQNAVDEACKAYFPVKRKTFSFSRATIANKEVWPSTDKLVVVKARVEESCEGLCGALRKEWELPIYQLGSWAPRYVALPPLDPLKAPLAWAKQIGGGLAPAGFCVGGNDVEAAMEEVRASESVSTAAEVRQTFRQWDNDGNGQISQEEMTEILGTLNPGLAAKSEELFAAADVNADGVLNFEEFLSWIFGPMPAATHDTVCEGVDCGALCIDADAGRLYYAGNGPVVGFVDLESQESQTLMDLEQDATSLVLHQGILFVTTKGSGADGNLEMINIAETAKTQVGGELSNPRGVAMSKSGADVFIIEDAAEAGKTLICRFPNPTSDPPPMMIDKTVVLTLTLDPASLGPARALYVPDEAATFFALGVAGKDCPGQQGAILVASVATGGIAPAAYPVASLRDMAMDAGGRLIVCGCSNNQSPGLFCLPRFKTAGDFGRAQYVCLDEEADPDSLE